MITFSRRAALVTTLGAASTEARAAAEFDTGNSTQLLQAFARLTGTIAGGEVLRWHTGVISAVMPGAAPKPLVAYDGLEKEIWTANADGAFTTTYFDIGYFKALGGDQPMTTWENPLTGQSSLPMPFRSGKFGAVLRGADFKREIDVRGDDIWFTSRPTVAFPALLKPEAYPEESAGPLHFFSVVRVDRGRVSDATNAAIVSAPLAWSYTLTTVWLPWMKMGQRPGAAVWTGVGGKYASANDVPATFKTFLAREQANYLAAGEPWDELRNMWGDYMKAHPPTKK